MGVVTLSPEFKCAHACGTVVLLSVSRGAYTVSCALKSYYVLRKITERTTYSSAYATGPCHCSFDFTAAWFIRSSLLVLELCFLVVVAEVRCGSSCDSARPIQGGLV
ncbi:hypothetical protein VPH35_091600 [Triticum aestivum]